MLLLLTSALHVPSSDSFGLLFLVEPNPKSFSSSSRSASSLSSRLLAVAGLELSLGGRRPISGELIGEVVVVEYESLSHGVDGEV